MVALAAVLMTTNIAGASLSLVGQSSAEAARPVSAQTSEPVHAKEAVLQQDVQGPKDDQANQESQAKQEKSEGKQDSQTEQGNEAKQDSQAKQGNRKVQTVRSQAHDWADRFTRRFRGFNRVLRVRW